MRHQGMREVPVADAVGMVLCHGVTRIVPGRFKGPAFRKGHVVTQNDIHELLRVGKEHIDVLDPMPGFVHEDDAARRIAAAMAGDNLSLTPACGPKAFRTRPWPGCTAPSACPSGPRRRRRSPSASWPNWWPSGGDVPPGRPRGAGRTYGGRNASGGPRGAAPLGIPGQGRRTAHRATRHGQ